MRPWQENGCDEYRHAALTSLVDLPGYVLGAVLADTRLGRRLTAALALALGGSCLLLTALSDAVMPAGSAAALANLLTLLGKFCAAAAFVQAYLFPAELFEPTLRGAALGVGNVFARTGTVLAPLAAAAPALYVQLGLGSVALAAGLATTWLPEPPARGASFSV